MIHHSLKLQYELNCAPIFDHLGSDLNIDIVEDLERHILRTAISEDYSGFFALRIRLNPYYILVGCIHCQQAFDTVLLNHDVGSRVGDAHDRGALVAIVPSVALQALEVEIGIELYRGLTGQLSHSVFPIHLVTLLRHLELIRHIIRETLNVNRGSQESMYEDVSVTSNRRREMCILGHGETEMPNLSHIYCGHTEVNSLIHAASGEDTNDLVEEGVIRSLS